MPGKPWFEFTPLERDDANRLGFLFETFQNDLQLGLVVDDFVMVVGNALDSEFAARAEGTYPPAGHSYPRLDED